MGACIAVSFGAAVRHVILGGPSLRGAFGETLLTVAEFPSLAKQALTEIWHDGYQVIGDRFPDLDGFRKSSNIQAGASEDKGYLLLSSYDKAKGQSTVQMIRIADQQILHEWLPDIDAMATLMNEKIVKCNYRIYHPLLLEDGGLVFHGMDFPLFKISLSSSVEWFVDGTYHHSIEQDAEGNIWVGSVMKPSSYAGTLSHRDDAIARISPAGEVLFEQSVARILEENGYRSLLAIGFSEDAIHLNDIQPALMDSRFWKRGDLLLSMRGRSTIVLYRPTTGKIIWLKTGPWMNQHDVDFVSDHQISVFGNDVIFDPGNGELAKARGVDRIFSQDVLLDGHSNVYIYDFCSDTVTTPYKKAMKSMDVRTVTHGRSEVLPNGDVFIEETNDGRILRLTPETAKWEFVRRVDKVHLSMPSWSRYLNEEQAQKVLPKLQNGSHY